MKNSILKWQSVKRKIATIVLTKITGTPFQFWLYTSYWHYKVLGTKKINADKGLQNNWYLAQQPNYSAGIGHQMGNWNAGFYYASFYGLRFAHFPFSNILWEKFLGFGEKEITAAALIADNSFKKVKLPRFDSENPAEITLVGNIIQSYNADKILFLLGLDQGYLRQYETGAHLSRKFFSASTRKENALLYNPNDFNIALHIRRGDIVTWKKEGYSNWEERWLSNEYYASVLKRVLQTINTPKRIQVYLFSQGKKEDFPELEGLGAINYCLDMNEYDSFLHLAYADLLISSKSSFSYKPALISKGIKIVPGSFWHSYPKTNDFITAKDDGAFDEKKLAVLEAV